MIKACFLLLILTGLASTYIGESFWKKVYNGVPEDGHNPVVFRDHPVDSDGYVDENKQLAYYLHSTPDNHAGYFGMTYLKGESLCATFNVNNTLLDTCSNFRILHHSYDTKGFFALVNTLEEEATKDAVGYYDIYATLLIDPTSGSSFYGSLSFSCTEAFAINNDKMIVNYVGSEMIAENNYYVTFKL
uniref:Astacin domain-containing protein n=1 Tax=Rhabditophanes sp. KR3021 TaxID=114890 RepID=A0AC35TNR2_9BILA